MSTTHTIITDYPLAGSDDGLPVEITYTYSPGRPAVMYQSNGDPGWPADPEEVEFCNVVLVCRDQLPDIIRAAIVAWARDWIEDDEGFCAACEKAFDALQPDPDYARENAADRRET